MPPASHPRILLTTAYRRHRRDFYDPAGANFIWSPRLAAPRTTSPGLRFLAQNLPELEILEFPLWEQYVEKLREGWDAVGFTWFQHEIPQVLRMAEQARAAGVSELWAGGYGALWEGTRTFADRVFYGYAEEELARDVFGRELGRLRHPPIGLPLNYHLPPPIPAKMMGYLFTQRGCARRCTFCQAQAHAPRPEPIPLESIDEVLRFYKRARINELWVFDETFYTFPEHSEAVIDLLARYGFHWWVQSRADLALRHLDSWAERGMTMLGFGLESVDDATLKQVHKQTDMEAIRELRRRLAEKRISSLAYYMIGYEHDTVESILGAYRELWKLAFDMYQMVVLTPFPRTPLWDDLDARFGIHHGDHERFDVRHLVWNHPQLQPHQARALLLLGMAVLNLPQRNYGLGLWRQFLKRLSDRPLPFLAELLRDPWIAARFRERENIYLP